MSGHQFGPGFFTLIFFGAVATAAAFLLAGPGKAATADAAFIMDLIPVWSMSSSPDFLSALLLSEKDRFYRSTLESLPTTVFLLAFILSDSLEGGVALVTAPFI
jgi:low temperature requirement protein LtrA